MISNPSIEVQTNSETRFSVPAWFAEVVIIAGYLEKKGFLEAVVPTGCATRCQEAKGEKHHLVRVMKSSLS